MNAEQDSDHCDHESDPSSLAELLVGWINSRLTDRKVAAGEHLQSAEDIECKPAASPHHPSSYVRTRGFSISRRGDTTHATAS